MQQTRTLRGLAPKFVREVVKWRLKFLEHQPQKSYSKYIKSLNLFALSFFPLRSTLFVTRKVLNAVYQFYINFIHCLSFL